jgi:hypothetical protein
MEAKTAYITSDEADIYYQGKVNGDKWNAMDLASRLRALIEASTILDEIDYLGDKADIQQEHEFPRYLIDRDFDNVLYDTDNVPLIIKYATAELALLLLSGFDRNKVISNNIVAKSEFGSVKTTYDRSGIPPWAKVGVTPEIWYLIQPLVRDPNTINISRVS